jgi:hypothetical protein
LTRRNFGRNAGLLGNLDMDNLDLNFLTKNTGFATTKKASYFTGLNNYDSDAEKNSENAAESQENRLLVIENIPSMQKFDGPNFFKDGAIKPKLNFDDIRQTSGKIVPREDMAIRID